MVYYVPARELRAHLVGSYAELGHEHERMIGEVGAASDGGDGFDELRSSSAAAAVSESIGKAVAAKFGLAHEAVSVSLTLDMSDVSAVQIVRADIVISEDDRTGDGRDVSEIGKFASELIGSPCTVSVK